MAKKSTSSAPKALQGVRNPDIYGIGAKNPNTPMAIDELRQSLSQAASADYRARSGNIGQEYASDASISNIQRRNNIDPLNTQGESMFDEPVMWNASDSSIQNTRAENEPWYAKVSAGVAKGVILAGTTFLDGTIGLVAGLGQMIENALEGKEEGETNSEYANKIFSGLFNNPFSNTLQHINDWSEEFMPNYYSTYEQEAPWYANILSANFIGDKFLKNIGFTVGAFYSGKVLTAPLKWATTGLQKAATTSKLMKQGKSFKEAMDITERALTRYGASSNSIIASHTGSFISALNEGRIEALNNSTDWLEQNKRALDSEHWARLQNIKNQYGEDTEQGKYLIQKEVDAYNQTLKALSVDAARVGNVDLLLNLPILHASNMIQFGRLYSKGFKDNVRALSVSRLADGTYGKMGRSGMIKAALKPIMAEGSEEALQQAASDIPSDYYAKDIQNFYKYKTNRKAEVEELNMIQSTASTLADTFTRGDTWEQFFIGGLTGAMGMPMFRSARTSEGKWQSPITIEGGSRQEVKEYINKMNKYNQLSDYMNNRLQDPKFQNYLQGLVRNRAYQNAMEVNLEEGDQKSYKDNEFGQLISDIMMFDQAGRLQDFRDMLDQANKLESDEDVQNLIDSTTSQVLTAEEQAKVNSLEQEIQAKQAVLNDTENPVAPDVTTQLNAEISSIQDQINQIKENSSGKFRGPYVDENGNKMSAQEVKEDLAKRTEEINHAMDSYTNTRDSIMQRFPSLSDDAISHLVYLQEQINNWDRRGAELGTEVQRNLQSVYADLLDQYKDDDTKDKERELVTRLQSLDGSKFARELRRDPSLTLFLDEAIQNFKDDNLDPNTSASQKEETITKLADMLNIVASRVAYNKALQHYFEHPETITQEQQQIDEEQAEENKQEANRSLAESLKGKSASEINNAINNGELTEDQVRESISEDDELFQGGFEALGIRDEVKRKKKKLQDAVDSGQISQDAANHATEMLDRAAITAEEVSDLNNLQSEAFNDLMDENLDANIIDAAIDEAKNALSLINQIEADEAQEAAELGGLLTEESPAPIDLEDAITVDLETKGPDPTSRVKPVNENTIIDEPPATEAVVTTEQVETQISEDSKDAKGPRESEESSNTPDPELGDAYDYWNPITTEYPIHRQRGDNRPYYEISGNPIHKVLYNFMMANNVFLNRRQLSKGAKIKFGFSKNLNAQVGSPVLLMFDEHNQIVGDLPFEPNLIAKRKGLKALYDKGTQELAKDSSEEDLFIIPNIESKVTHELVGKPQYTRTEERHSLNDICTEIDSNGNPIRTTPKIGIAVRDEGSTNLRMVVSGKKKSERTLEDRKSMVSPNAVPGQPFLMIETSSHSRSYYPVPIIMPKLGELGNSTLKSIIDEMLSYNTMSALTESTVLGWKDDLHSLLQFYDIRIEFDKQGTFAGIKVKLNATDNYTDVPHIGLQDFLKNCAITVDLNSLNDENFMDSGKNYNSIIGEVAYTNLPEGGNHTINDWFAIAPIIDEKADLDEKGKSKSQGPTPLDISRRAEQEMFEFRDKKNQLWAFNTRTNDLYHKGKKLDMSDPKIQLLAARAYLLANDLLDGETRDTPFGKYNPNTNSFSREDIQPTSLITSDEELFQGGLDSLFNSQEQQSTSTQETSQETKPTQETKTEVKVDTKPKVKPKVETPTTSTEIRELTASQRETIQKDLTKLISGNPKWKAIVSKFSDEDLQIFHSLAQSSSIKARNIARKLLATNGKLSLSSLVTTEVKPVVKPETKPKVEEKKLLPNVPNNASDNTEIGKKLREILTNEGITEEQYNMMSIEEKNQFAQCRGLI